MSDQLCEWRAGVSDQLCEWRVGVSGKVRTGCIEDRCQGYGWYRIQHTYYDIWSTQPPPYLRRCNEGGFRVKVRIRVSIRVRFRAKVRVRIRVR